MAKQTADIRGFEQLKLAIKSGEYHNLYIFFGEETFLLHHYLNEIRKKTIDPLTQDFNYHRFTQENFTLEDFADSVEALPMMAERTMVQVDDIDLFKMNESDRDKIIDVITDVPEYCTLIFTFETVEWKPDKRLKKLWSAIEKNSILVEFAKQNQRELVSWITRHFQQEHKSISADLCNYLIEITGGTMTALQGEIKKISAYSGAEEIKKSDIDAVTEPVLSAVVFEMTDLLGEGRYGAALGKLQQLLKMQQEPILILGAVGSHFRRISTAITLSGAGKGYQELMRLAGMGDYPAKRTMNAARKFTPEFCRTAAELVLQTDYKMKTSYDDKERLLELLILQLAQEAKHD